MTSTIAAWNGGHDQLTQAAELYADVFSESPYDEERSQSIESFTSRVRRYAAEKPSFRLLIASEGDRVVGLVLGTGASRGDWWWDRLEEWCRQTCRRSGSTRSASLWRNSPSTPRTAVTGSQPR